MERVILALDEDTHPHLTASPFLHHYEDYDEGYEEGTDDDYGSKLPAIECCDHLPKYLVGSSMFS